MKKSYTDKKRTAIALDPETTKRIGKVLKNSDMKISTYTQVAIKSALDADEVKQNLEDMKKITSAAQYQKIKQLEGEVEKLKEDHTSVKEIMQTVKEGLDDLEEDVTKTILEMPKIIEQRVAHSFLEGMNKELDKDGVPERKKESVLKELMGDTRYKQFKKLAKTPSNKKHKKRKK